MKRILFIVGCLIGSLACFSDQVNLNPLEEYRLDWSDPKVRAEYSKIQRQASEIYGGPRPIDVPDDFGESKYDKRVKNLADLNNLDEFRKQERNKDFKTVGIISAAALLFFFLVYILVHRTN